MRGFGAENLGTMSVQFDGNGIGPREDIFPACLVLLQSSVKITPGRQGRIVPGRSYYLQVEGLGETSVKARGADEEEDLGLVLQVAFLQRVGPAWGRESISAGEVNI